MLYISFTIGIYNLRLTKGRTTHIRTMGKETDSVDLELERLADLLAYLIEKYGDKIELESLPDPPRPTTE